MSLSLSWVCKCYSQRPINREVELRCFFNSNLKLKHDCLWDFSSYSMTLKKIQDSYWVPMVLKYKATSLKKVRARCKKCEDKSPTSRTLGLWLCCVSIWVLNPQELFGLNYISLSYKYIWSDGSLLHQSTCVYS